VQDSPDGRPGAAAFPVKLKGVVEWEGGRQPVDTTLGK
jgi:fimbrial chaperone protein